MAQKPEVPKPWMDNRIYNGAIQVDTHDRAGLYPFPNDSATIESFRKLKEGKIHKLRF